MPELAGVTHAPVTSPATQQAETLQFPVPWPGMPQGLEHLSGVELGWWGNRYGVDSPIVYAPSGWGEQVPLFGEAALAFLAPDPIHQGGRTGDSDVASGSDDDSGGALAQALAYTDAETKRAEAEEAAIAARLAAEEATRAAADVTIDGGAAA